MKILLRNGLCFWRGMMFSSWVFGDRRTNRRINPPTTRSALEETRKRAVKNCLRRRREDHLLGQQQTHHLSNTNTFSLRVLRDDKTQNTNPYPVF